MAHGPLVSIGRSLLSILLNGRVPLDGVEHCFRTIGVVFVRQFMFGASILAAAVVGMGQGPTAEPVDHLAALSGSAGPGCRFYGYGTYLCELMNDACTFGGFHLAQGGAVDLYDYRATDGIYNNGNCVGSALCPSGFDTYKLTSQGCNE